MADRHIPLCILFRNPVIRDAFRRADRDNGAAFVIPAPKPPVLPAGGAVLTIDTLTMGNA